MASPRPPGALLPALLAGLLLVPAGAASARPVAVSPGSDRTVTASTTARISTTAAASTAARAKPPRQRRIREYVSLGDSWSADVVLAERDGAPDRTHVPTDCGQSRRNYPKLVAAKLRVTIHRDATCNSATIASLMRTQRLQLGGRNSPQFDRLSGSTDLVTLGIGGYDAGVVGAGENCLNMLPFDLTLASSFGGDAVPFGGCRERYTDGGTDQLSRSIRATQSPLVRALRQIRRRAPQARVLVLDYLSLIPDHGCYPTLPASDEDMAYLHAKFIELNEMLRRAAKRGGAEYVATFKPTLGHDLCQLPHLRYGETFGPSVNDPAVGAPAHPNAAGARAQARLVLDHLVRRRPRL